MSSYAIAFIGAGNMASAIIGGLLASGMDASRLHVANRGTEKLEAMRALGIGNLGSDNRAAAAAADVVVLAIKPKQLREVCRELAPALRPQQLVMSVAAGVEAQSIAGWLGGHGAVVRCMPNTPSALRCGASGLYALPAVSQEQRQQAATVMAAVGVVEWVEEEALLHAVTAVAGSAPAYFFLFMEAIIAEGERMGLDGDAVRKLCAQTCIGAGRMVAEGELDAGELRRRVCSPGGTTERAVAAFESGGLRELVARAMQDCYRRSEEMARELS
jgi:pyrroline-5-carboxylate reductase